MRINIFIKEALIAFRGPTRNARSLPPGNAERLLGTAFTTWQEQGQMMPARQYKAVPFS